MIKMLNKIAVEEDFLNLIRKIYKKPTLTFYSMLRN